MSKLIQRNTNRPALTHRPLSLYNKKNKVINNKPMNQKQLIPKITPLPRPPISNPKVIDLTVQQKHEQDHSEQQTKSTEEDEDCLLFVQRLPCPRFNHELREYKQQIWQYVKGREQAFLIDTSYLSNHKVITVKMRRYLVRHLFKIYRRFSLLRSTLHLAVHYMDLYLVRQDHFGNLQETIAIAQSCLFIAMKYEQIYPPDLSQWIDRRYRSQILKLQAQILKTLDYQLAHYTLDTFIHFHMWQLSDTSSENIKQEDNQMLFLTDLTLFDLNLRKFRYSQLAECIYGVTHGVSEKEFDVDMVLNLKCMVERNQETVSWLVQQKYCKGVLNFS